MACRGSAVRIRYAPPFPTGIHLKISCCEWSLGDSNYRNLISARLTVDFLITFVTAPLLILWFWTSHKFLDGLAVGSNHRWGLVNITIHFRAMIFIQFIVSQSSLSASLLCG